MLKDDKKLPSILCLSQNRSWFKVFYLNQESKITRCPLEKEDLQVFPHSPQNFWHLPLNFSSQKLKIHLYHLDDLNSHSLTIKYMLRIQLEDKNIRIFQLSEFNVLIESIKANRREVRSGRKGFPSNG